MRSASVGNTTIQVFNLGQLANGVSLANSVMSALGLNVPAAAAAASTPAALQRRRRRQTATALLDLLDDNSVADVLASDAAMDHVGRATCERAAANLERLAAQLRRGELCQLRLQRNGELLRRLAADVQQARRLQLPKAAPQRAPSGVQGSASLQDIVSATVARIGATDFNLQSLSQSIGSSAESIVKRCRTSHCECDLGCTTGHEWRCRRNRATPPPAPPVVPAAATATTASQQLLLLTTMIISTRCVPSSRLCLARWV
jgi:hypothetical protein